MSYTRISRFLGSSAIALAFAIAAYSANSIAAAPSASAPTAIEVLLSGGAGRQNVSSSELAQLQRVYAERNFHPLWSGSAEALERRQIARNVLARAAEHGLEPSRYASILPTLEDGVGGQAAETDIGLTLDVLRYAHDIRSGRLPATSIYRDVDLPQATFDRASALASAVNRGEIANFLVDLPPPHPQYERLVAAMVRYRNIEAHGGWSSIPGNREVKTDGSDPRLELLMQRLRVEDPEATDPVTAVKHYQQRNGLTADGRVGSLTLEMLNIPAADRVAQIGANLERWRWLPRAFETRHIAVNVPDQSLSFVENGKVLLTSRVIIGRPQTPTPIFRATAVAVTVNPPWNVPHSIAVKEILPRLRRQPNYLATEGMVLLNGPADDPTGTHIDWRRVSADRFPYRIQQLPADKNALGKLKLELPNRFSVYLHDTPGKAAFERDQRALSHGCIRVQEIFSLAALAIGGDPKVTRNDLDTLIAAGTTVQTPLTEPLPVYVLYWTVITAEDGSVGFRRDLYGRDSRLNAAWRERLATATPAGAIGGCSYEG